MQEKNNTKTVKSTNANSISLMRLLGCNFALRERRIKLLQDLLWWVDRYNGPPTPMDIGGYDASYHSGDLLYLTKKGLVERIPRFVGVRQIFGVSGSNRYGITKLGRQAAKLSP